MYLRAAVAVVQAPDSGSLGVLALVEVKANNPSQVATRPGKAVSELPQTRDALCSFVP